MSTAYVAALVYGDFLPGRKVSNACRDVLGVRPELWDKPCPAGWRPHAEDARTERRRRDAGPAAER